MKESKDNFIIFSINGGVGKNIMATAVVKAIKKANPDKNIIVITAYKEIWLYNPNVYRTYQFGQTPYFYRDFIEGKNTEILALEPYSTQQYILKEKHLIDIWCGLCGVKYNKEKPELFFNAREVEYVKNKIIGDRKRIFLIQTNGGAKAQSLPISWMRDLPLETAQKVVDAFMNEYRIIQVRREDQPALKNVEYFNGSIRELFVLVRESHKRLFIDSACQHIASALGKESTVCWVRNKPETLGYSIHDNILAKQDDELDSLSYSLLEPYEITGFIDQCPFKEGTQLFDEQEIIESIRNQKNILLHDKNSNGINNDIKPNSNKKSSKGDNEKLISVEQKD